MHKLLFSDIFDVVRDSKDHVYLVDFSPFGEEWSEPLAFDWTDLIASDDDVSKSTTLNLTVN